MHKAIAILGTLVILAGCASNGVKNEVITQTNVNQISNDVDSNLWENDKRLFYGGKFRASVTKDYSIIGKTVGQIINDEDQWEKDKHQADIDSKHAKYKAISDMANVISVAPVSKRVAYTKQVKKDILYVTLQFTNKGTKPVKYIRGTIIFISSYNGDKIIPLQLQVGATNAKISLSPGYKVQNELAWVYDKNDPEYVNFKNVDMQQIQMEWIPKILVFTDNTIMTAPEIDSTLETQ